MLIVSMMLFAGLYSHEESQDPQCVHRCTTYIILLAGYTILWKNKLQTEMLYEHWKLSMLLSVSPTVISFPFSIKSRNLVMLLAVHLLPTCMSKFMRII